jgi:hypothetical protein
MSLNPPRGLLIDLWTVQLAGKGLRCSKNNFHVYFIYWEHFGMNSVYLTFEMRIVADLSLHFTHKI